MIFLQLIWVFLKIGILGFGGGYAMLSLIQDEVVRNNQWMSNEEFTDLVAISQSTPGPIGINTATFVGFKAVENAGYSTFSASLASLFSTLIVCLPAFVLILLISYSLKKFKEHPYFKNILEFLKPMSLALIGYAAYSLMTPNNFIDNYSILLFLIALITSILYRPHPIIILIIAAILGIIIY